MPPLLAAAIATTIVLLAFGFRTLSKSGVIAAWFVGFMICWSLGWNGLALLTAFFLPTTLISRIAARADLRSDEAATQARNYRQVIANGGFAALACLAEFEEPGRGIWLVTITFAAAASDTWATAFGRLSLRPPRDIRTAKSVPAGTSGGVTWFGSTGGVMGAAAMGLTGETIGTIPVFLPATAIGFLAMLVDSFLGSALQARFYCDACHTPTDRGVHACGAPSRHLANRRWIDNDVVNALSTGSSLIAGMITWRLVQGA